MSEVKLTGTENIQTYDVSVGEKEIDGEITNRGGDGEFLFKSADYGCTYSAPELKAIAEKINELNNLSVYVKNA